MAPGSPGPGRARHAPARLRRGRLTFSWADTVARQPQALAWAGSGRARAQPRAALARVGEHPGRRGGGLERAAPSAGGRCASSLCAEAGKLRCQRLPESPSSAGGVSSVEAPSSSSSTSLVTARTRSSRSRSPRPRTAGAPHHSSQHRRGPGRRPPRRDILRSAGPGDPERHAPPRRGCPGGARAVLAAARAAPGRWGSRTHCSPGARSSLRARPELRSFRWMAQRSAAERGAVEVGSAHSSTHQAVRPCRVT